MKINCMNRYGIIFLITLFISSCSDPDPCSEFITRDDISIMPFYDCNDTDQVQLSLSAWIDIPNNEIRELNLTYDWLINGISYQGRTIEELPSNTERVVLQVSNAGCNLEIMTELDLTSSLRHQGYLGNTVWMEKLGSFGIFNCLDNGDYGLNGFLVDLLDPVDSTIIDQQETENTGLYLFCNLSPGDYLIRFNNPYTSKSFVSSNNCHETSDSDCNSEGYTEVITIAECEINLTIDAGLRDI